MFNKLFHHVRPCEVRELCQNRSGLLALANRGSDCCRADEMLVSNVSREHTIQISDRRLLLSLATKSYRLWPEDACDQ
jgi:hypothetical protein